MEPLPYYKWLVRDYRANRKVQRMGYVAKGLYRELLDEAWLEGSLPSDFEGLAEICGCPAKVIERAWPEIAPCFEERDGRMFNAKLESQRTATDAARVKMSASGAVGGKKSNSSTRVGKPTISPPLDDIKGAQANPDIAEQSRAEQRREEKNSSRGKSASDDGMKHSKDPRHIAFKNAIGEYWQSKNPGIDMPWGGHEGKELGMWLREAPHITIEQFKGFLRGRFRSDVNHGERPSQWIRWITSYGQPVDRFGKPQGGGADGKTGTGNSAPSITKQRVDRNLAAIDKALERRGLSAVGLDREADGAELSGAGSERIAGGLSVGLRAVVPPLQPDAGNVGAGRAENPTGPEILPPAA